jgi:galactokinase
MVLEDDVLILAPVVTKVQDTPVVDTIVHKTKKTIIKRPIITTVIDQPVVEIQRNTTVAKEEYNNEYQSRIHEIKQTAKTLPPATSEVKKTFIARVVEEFTREERLIRRTRTYVIEIV